jgi:hypothetical protein
MKKYLVIFIALLMVMMACAVAASADEPYPVQPGKVIDYGEIGQITEVGGHAVDPTKYEELYPPTCTERGLVRYPCMTPDAHAGTTAWHYVQTEALGHIMSSADGGDNWGRVVGEPTCTEPGLAVDICTRPGCDYVDWDHTREIAPRGHTFFMDVYREAIPPRCNAVGYGVRTCIHCGADCDADLETLAATRTTVVVIAMVDHNWSEWRIVSESTCKDYGEAQRTCIWCGDSQVLNKDNLIVKDHGKDISIDTVNPKKNDGWQKASGVLNNAQFASEAAEITAYEVDVPAQVGTKEFYPVVSKNWLKDCYTREITLSCPYCEGTVHDDIKYERIYPYTIAHTWVLRPAVANDAATEAEIKQEDWLNHQTVEGVEGDWSLEPTCVLPGFDLYLCDKDEVHSHPSNEYPADKAYKKEMKNPLGHEWGEWRVVERFEKDGEIYVKRVCTCERGKCGAVQNEVIKESDIPVPPEPEVKNGLVLDPDGQFRYYKDGEFYPLTNIVRYDGAEFWVVEGVVPLNATGVTVCPDGKAYFLVAGQIVRVSGFEEYQNEWFIINNGLVDTNANGLFDYNGGKFVFAAGKLRRDVDGLWQNPQDKKWYFMAKGELQKVSQVAGYNGQFFVIKDGILDESYNGTIEYDGATFRVVNGQLYPM